MFFFRKSSMVLKKDSARTTNFSQAEDSFENVEVPFDQTKVSVRAEKS